MDGVVTFPSPRRQKHFYTNIWTVENLGFSRKKKTRNPRVEDINGKFKGVSRNLRKKRNFQGVQCKKWKISGNSRGVMFEKKSIFSHGVENTSWKIPFKINFNCFVNHYNSEYKKKNRRPRIYAARFTRKKVLGKNLICFL